MGIIRMIDRRSEPRTPCDLALTVWGVDSAGKRFRQEARARDISLSGALLSGMDTGLRSGDVVGILCGGKTARFRVVWIRYDGMGDKMEVAVHRFEADSCPWVDLLLDHSLTPQPLPTETQPLPES